MAWVAEDTFEVATVGNWEGVATGSGWSGNWTRVTGVAAEYQIVSSPVGEATRGASIQASTNGAYMTRALTTGESGTDSVFFLVRRNSTSAANGARFGVTTASVATQYLVGMYGSSIIMFTSTGQQTVASGLSANTWYEIELEYNTAASTYRCRSRPQLGSWGSYTASYGSDGGGTGNITLFMCQQLGTDDTWQYLDRIAATEEPAAAGGGTSTMMLMGVGT